MNNDRNSHHTFQTTRWSIVYGAAGRKSPEESKRALAELCETYWSPLYAYLRRSGLSPSDSEDTVQGFFAMLLDREDFVSLSPEKGRFRAFLLASLKHFLSNQRDHARAIKRGGGAMIVSLDCAEAELSIATNIAHTETAEVVFERQWAMTLLANARAQLVEQQAEPRRELYAALIVYLTGECSSPAYAEAAAQFSMTEGAIKMTVNRMRRQYRDILRLAIAHTVASPQEIEEEIRHLITVLQSA